MPETPALDKPEIVGAYFSGDLGKNIPPKLLEEAEYDSDEGEIAKEITQEVAKMETEIDDGMKANEQINEQPAKVLEMKIGETELANTGSLEKTESQQEAAAPQQIETIGSGVSETATAGEENPSAKEEAAEIIMAIPDKPDQEPIGTTAPVETSESIETAVPIQIGNEQVENKPIAEESAPSLPEGNKETQNEIGENPTVSEEPKEEPIAVDIKVGSGNIPVKEESLPSAREVFAGAKPEAVVEESGNELNSSDGTYEIKTDTEEVTGIKKETPREVLEGVGKKIIECFEQYKSPSLERSKQIDLIEQLAGHISGKNEKDDAPDVHQAVLDVLKKMKTRTELNAAKKSLNLPVELKDLSEGENGSHKIIIEALGTMLNEDKAMLDKFIYDLGEMILYRMSHTDRETTGKKIIEIAKEEMEQAGGIPPAEALKPIFDREFGEEVKKSGLFDLGVLGREIEIVQDTAREKGIDNIVKLTEAFREYLGEKREAKEKATQNFLGERLKKMAA